jgi:hypothetical protein
MLHATLLKSKLRTLLSSKNKWLKSRGLQVFLGLVCIYLTPLFLPRSNSKLFYEGFFMLQLSQESDAFFQVFASAN